MSASSPCTDHLALPLHLALQVGGGARKTNKDYTGGKLPELIDVIIASGASLFVSAVGIPPRYAVDKLHDAGIPGMFMFATAATRRPCLRVTALCACSVAQ